MRRARVRTFSLTPPAEWVTRCRGSVRPRRSLWGWGARSPATPAVETIAATPSRKLGGPTLRWVAPPSPDHSGRPCRAAESSSGERRGGMALILPLVGLRVQAALRLVRARPAARAGILARGDRAGARRAADRAVAQLEQR